MVFSLWQLLNKNSCLDEQQKKKKSLFVTNPPIIRENARSQQNPKRISERNFSVELTVGNNNNNNNLKQSEDGFVFAADAGDTQLCPLFDTLLWLLSAYCWFDPNGISNAKYINLWVSWIVCNN